jgi:hypothetical protein
MGIHSEEEGDEQVMRVPEGLEGLLTDLCMRSRIHQKHTEKHDVSCDTTCFGVVDLDGCDFSDLSPLDIEETDAVSME